MGFRDLKSFNLAMLGKQVWRIIANPHSLLSRVFKAKYFSDCDIFYAKPKSNASFTWKSICNSLDLVKKGIRWRVGNGENIGVWVDNWIPRTSIMRPITPDLLELGDISVSMLIDSTVGAWDVDVIRGIFWEEDVDSILQIPVSQNHGQDIRIWHFTKHGHYSVRSAYYLARDMKKDVRRNVLGCSSSLVAVNWDWIWSLKLPNRIKVFFMACFEEFFTG